MTILLLGGTSDIGTAIVQRICAGEKVVCAARNVAAIPDFPAAASVERVHFEAGDLKSHRQLVESVGEIDTAIVAFGILGDQARAEHDEAHAAEIADIDYRAQVSMLTVLADHMDKGRIVAFSSIAGWRPRRANYVYGSTKAGLDAFCQGLADRLHKTSLELYIARPGFVIGSMTEGMSPAPLSVTPDQVADAVVKRFGRPGTLWIPPALAILAAVMRCVPRAVWRHMPR